jgi:hypothetical protein
VRPCVARGFRRSGGCAVLHQCIRPLIGARCALRAIMDISARAISLPDRPRTGHLGHRCSHAPGRPILHLVSSSRRPRRVTDVGVTSSIAPHLAQFLCSCLRPAVPSSRPTFGLEHGRDSGWSERCLVRPDVFEVALLVENGPGDTGKLVGERDCQHVVVQPLGGRIAQTP